MAVKESTLIKYLFTWKLFGDDFDCDKNFVEVHDFTDAQLEEFVSSHSKLRDFTVQFICVCPIYPHMRPM